MSLVAYDSDQESDSNDTRYQDEETEAPKKKVENSESRCNLVTIAPDIESSPNKETANDIAKSESSSRISQLFASLPTPKSTGKEKVEIEDEVTDVPLANHKTSIQGDKSKQRQHVLLKLPLDKAKTHHRIQIAAPALFDNHSDSDDESSAKKKQKVSNSKGVGLFALLPEPKHASKKEANRPLIPHSLTKKTPPLLTKSTPTVVTPTASKTVSSITEGEFSDSDEDESGFFSLNLPASTSTAATATLGLLSMPVDQTQPSGASVRTSIVPYSEELPSDYDGSKNETLASDNAANASIEQTALSAQQGAVSTQQSTLNTQHGNAELQDKPLQFATKQHDRLQMHPVHSDSTHGNLNAVPQEFSQTQTAQYNYSLYDNQPHTADYLHQGLQDNLLAPQFQKDSEFLKMQGKRERRLEHINIIDVNADDQLANVEDHLLKSLTEEKEHRSKRKKDDLPSAQQKRKHQLGYLAFQAKEKELELKNAWAQNRQTRKQTQSKYGF